MKPVYCLLLFALILTGCEVVENRIGDREAATPTPELFNTATPGGYISVWMIPTGSPPAVADASQIQGQVVGPAATATSLIMTIEAATATALAPTPQPAFRGRDCPTPTGRTAPALPPSFTDFPATIGVFMSNGGSAAVLESTLRTWGAITAQGGVVQAETDLTGDGVPELLVTLFNPYTYNPEAVLNAGQLLVYGCDNNAYRLLYSTPNNPGLALPILHRVGDMNADVKAELVFDIQTCTLTYCSREGYILTWNPVVGVFENLNSGQIFSINGRLGVTDIDSDGILELTVNQNPPTTASSGPTRGVVDVWDWTGVNYVLATRLQADPLYRIHALQDADTILREGTTRDALRAYLDARDSDTLLNWTVPNEAALLRAFLNFRIMTSYARLGDERVERFYTTLLSENPEGSAGAGYAALGTAFIEAYRAGAGSGGGCQAALAVAATRPETLSFLNSFGTANRAYTLSDLCPF